MKAWIVWMGLFSAMMLGLIAVPRDMLSAFILPYVVGALIFSAALTQLTFGKARKAKRERPEEQE